MANVLKSSKARRFAGKALANYFKFVALTSRMSGSMEPHFAEVAANLPAIFTFWHGEQFLIPTAVAGHLPLCALVSRNLDGDIQAAALESFGVQTIRGSGGRSRARTIAKGGVQSSLEIISALKSGISTCMTANVPHGPAREVGKGVIAMAKFSGRPIYPVSHMTNRNVFLDSWDHAAINLPFAKAVFMLGTPLWVDCEADQNSLEASRLTLQKELLRITLEAQRQLGLKSK